MPFIATRRALLSSTSVLLPTYLADFTTASLPSGVTVSSPSLGGLVTDASGKLTYKPNNLLTQSNTFSNAAWGSGGVTLTGGQSDPLGGSTAYRLQGTGSWGLYQGAPSGIRAVLSVWVKSNTGSAQKLRLLIGQTIYSADLTATTTWQQLSFAASNGGSGFVGIYSDAASDNADILIYAATLSAVTYETTPRPGDQVITTPSAYYGPAWDYDPVNVGTPLGLRVWESRVNYLPQSSALTNGAWALGTATSSLGASAPDGSTNALTLSSQAGGLSQQYASLTGVPTGANTNSIHIKAGSAAYIWLAIYDGGTAYRTYVNTSNMTVASTDTGATGSITPAPGGFYRLSINRTVASNASNFFVFGVSDAAGSTAVSANGKTGIFFGPQAEAAATAGPYIPTGASAVTAAADVPTTTIPAGVTTIRYTFDDNSTQDVAVSPGAYTIPYIGLNRHRIKRIRSWPN